MCLRIYEENVSRTCTEKYKSYRSYKSYLVKDFKNICGYCGDWDFYFGGYRGYQIDHFKPKKKYPDLEFEYANLVYSCPYCNRAKSDSVDECEVNRFVDPCEEEYHEHIFRNADGSIGYKTDTGKFIFHKIKLGLLRHQLIWLIQKMRGQLDKISELIAKDSGDDTDIELTLLRQYKEMNEKILHYTSQLARDNE